MRRFLAYLFSALTLFYLGSGIVGLTQGNQMTFAILVDFFCFGCYSYCAFVWFRRAKDPWK